MSADVTALNTEFAAEHRACTSLRHLMAKGEARAIGLGVKALDRFEKHWSDDKHIDEVRTRAAVGGMTLDVLNPPVFMADLAARISRDQLLSRLPGTIQASPNAETSYPTSFPVAKWITKGGLIPAGRGSFAREKLTPYLVGSIIIASNDLLRAAGPRSEKNFEDLLTHSATMILDQALLDPANDGDPEVAPPSITSGAFTTPSTGSDAASLSHDIGLIADNMLAAGVVLISPVVIMSPASALRVGGIAVPGPGGSTLAPPVFTSPAAGNNVILLDTASLMFTDDGIVIDISTEANVVMSDEPTGNIVIPEAATGPIVSLYQTNSTGFRYVQHANWKMLDPAAVGVVTGFGVAP